MTNCGACGRCGGELPDWDDDPGRLDVRMSRGPWELHDYHLECYWRERWDEWKRIVSRVRYDDC